MRIVEIEHVSARRVDECGAEQVEPVAPADHAGVARAGETVEYGERAGDRGVPAAAERGAEEVEERAAGGVTDVVGTSSQRDDRRKSVSAPVTEACCIGPRYHNGRHPALLPPLRALCDQFKQAFDAG